MLRTAIQLVHDESEQHCHRNNIQTALLRLVLL